MKALLSIKDHNLCPVIRPLKLSVPASTGLQSVKGGPKPSLQGRFKRRIVLNGSVECRCAMAPAFGITERMPKWRNGRRDGLKNRWAKARVGSTPSFGTNILRSPCPRPEPVEGPTLFSLSPGGLTRVDENRIVAMIVGQPHSMAPDAPGRAVNSFSVLQ